MIHSLSTSQRGIASDSSLRSHGTITCSDVLLRQAVSKFTAYQMKYGISAESQCGG